MTDSPGWFWNHSATVAAHEEEQGKRLIESLDPADYQNQFERAKAGIIKESPWLAAHQDSIVFKGIVESRILDHLKEGPSEDVKVTEEGETVLFGGCSGNK